MSHPDTVSTDSLPTENCKQSCHSSQVSWRGKIVPLILLSLILGLLFRDGLVWLLFEIWSHNDYSHGYLVPFISLYLVWTQRERFALLRSAPAYPAAFMVILVSLILLLISRCSAIIQLEAVSLFLIIPGVLLVLWGWQAVRAALLPWLYLSFALPWFEVFLGHVQPSFQHITAILGSILLRPIYYVFREGNYIFLPSITLNVAKECSGVVFFISILAIGVPLVYLTQRSWLRAVLVLALGIFITIIANGLRVAMAGIMGENFGPELLHGPAHILQGMFVAWVGWGGVFLVNWLVAKKSNLTSVKLCDRWRLRAVPNQQHQQTPRISLKQMYSASFILTLCVLLIYFVSPHPQPLSTSLTKSFPTQVANWTGTKEGWLDQESFFPGADEQLSYSYHSTQVDATVYLYIAYFKKQTEQKRLVSRYSRSLHEKAVDISLQTSNQKGVLEKVNATTLKLNDHFYDVVHWYQFSDGKTATGRNKARWLSLENGILHRKNNGAVVLVATLHNKEKEKIQLSIPPSIADFLQSISSTLSEVLP